jgi:hypothetical protein
MRYVAAALAPALICLLNHQPAHAEAAEADSAARQFEIELDNGALVSLRRANDAVDTQYIARGRRLGDVVLKFRPAGGGEWQTALTGALAGTDAASHSAGGDGRKVESTYRIGGDAALLSMAVRLEIQDAAILWTIELRNESDQAVEIGDLALPFPMNSSFREAGSASAAAFKHHFISGHGSFLYWTRARGGPYLTLTPIGQTKLEYWEPPQRGFGRPGGGGGRGQAATATSDFRAFIHSAAAGAAAKERGCNWRQPHTSLTLAPKGKAGDSQSYAFKYRWADDLDGVRDVLFDEALIDVEVVPGMTVPSDLFARVALRTREPIAVVEAEFPEDTKIESLGKRGDYHIYQVRFDRLGENRLTVKFGDERHLHLEFFATEPLETVIKKRAAFLARSQHRDPSKWYNGLITDWNMESHVLVSPDNYDRIRGFRIYAVTCDDPGLAKPAFLAAKNAEHPLASEVEAVDYYIKHFVWGGLQMTADEPYPYAIYGIQDWKRNRDSDDPGRNGKLHIWRCYDYPHIVLMYLSMYRVAKLHPHIPTELSAEEYLKRAGGTAAAMFTVPREVANWSAYGTGFYNELVIVDLIDDLRAAGMAEQADALQGHWERKVRFFAANRADLFRSEYPFDSTGFESTHALANYAVEHATDAEDATASEGEDRDDDAGLGVTPGAARRFMERQMEANLFCRGAIEPAYYFLGSDYRGSGGNSYTLTYMSQMGGWSVLDYGLRTAADPFPYVRLGYASYLSAWALVNSGTPESNYGYWYPGKENDGGAGGGFEPAPFGQTWLGQPHHRGSWYYACESDLGFSGGLRAARTVVADDPIFGRFCFGGEMHEGPDGLRITPKDGVRRRFSAILDASKLHLTVEGGRFADGKPLALEDDLSEVRFSLESHNPKEHTAKLVVSGSAGRYAITVDGKKVADIELDGQHQAIIDASIKAGDAPVEAAITRVNASQPTQ